MHTDYGMPYRIKLKRLLDDYKSIKSVFNQTLNNVKIKSFYGPINAYPKSMRAEIVKSSLIKKFQETAKVLHDDGRISGELKKELSDKIKLF